MKQGIVASDLLLLVILAILTGIIGGWYLPHWVVRTFLTFNGLFSQFLGFMVPLLIIGLIAPGITDLGKGVGRLLVYTVALSYGFTVFAGMLTYGSALLTYPYILHTTSASALASFTSPQQLTLYFTLPIAPIMDVATALTLAFVLGLGASFTSSQILRGLLSDLRAVVYKVISNVIIPVLPLYVFGVFMGMAANGQVAGVVSVFFKVVIFLFALTLLILAIQFAIAALVSKKNMFAIWKAMLPAYFTALGTSSSAATIPVTYRQVQSLGVREGVAGFTVPLCASIHMAGSTIKIVGCSLALLWLTGNNLDSVHFTGFIFLVSLAMVAGPGVPGGAVMAAVGVLQQMLGFDEQMLGLMITLYIAMDSFGTACNVAGDGAVSVIIDSLYKEKQNYI
ncbi:MAG: dicarboxylate/amino acid:cation symporter [Elusimicrobiaceae bacterium]|nr:dicarboxylate/amino acid:cation symporter [Elusimicrobiaceae bacterium]